MADQPSAWQDSRRCLPATSTHPVSSALTVIGLSSPDRWMLCWSSEKSDCSRLRGGTDIWSMGSRTYSEAMVTVPRHTRAPTCEDHEHCVRLPEHTLGTALAADHGGGHSAAPCPRCRGCPRVHLPQRWRP